MPAEVGPLSEAVVTKYLETSIQVKEYPIVIPYHCTVYTCVRGWLRWEESHGTADIYSTL